MNRLRGSAGRSFMPEAPLLLVSTRPRPVSTPPRARLRDDAATAAEAGAGAGAVTVLVSHRFSTVRLAELIVVVDGGQIVATGGHEELIAPPGLYAGLHALKARA